MPDKNKQNIIVSQNANTIKSIEPVFSGEDYFSRLQHIINKAESEIHLQTYIFENDTTGMKIAECLKEAAMRKVNVYVLLDGYGSNTLPGELTNNLINHGVNLRFFSANIVLIGRRLHHKVVVADGKTALIGGINIADKYHGTKTEEPWLDFALQVEGKIAEPLQELCRNIYFRKKRKNRKKIMAAFYSDDLISVRVLQNDWLKRKNEICIAYLKSIRNSKKEVIIVGSYFLPGRRISESLKKAARNGVKIKLILAGISDVPLMRLASSYLYSSLLKNKIELYEWNKSVLHGKAAVIDSEWITIGSFNLNHLSSYGSIEMNLEIVSPEFAAYFASYLHTVIAQSEKITAETLIARKGIITKLLNWFFYLLVRTGMILIAYTTYKRIFQQSHDE
jgi:cardiolipin synthase A/B